VSGTVPGEALSGTQRFVRLLIRLMLPVFVLAGLGGYSSLFLVGMNAQPPIKRVVWSPGGHYRASVMEGSEAGVCGDQPKFAFVLVERRNDLRIKTGEFLPFCRGGGEQGIDVKWVDDTTLAVSCRGCNGDYGYAHQNWGRLRFVYDLDRP
jgi:hypothetical protein